MKQREDNEDKKNTEIVESKVLMTEDVQSSAFVYLLIFFIWKSDRSLPISEWRASSMMLSPPWIVDTDRESLAVFDVSIICVSNMVRKYSQDREKKALVRSIGYDATRITCVTKRKYLSIYV